jgi:hypothetical protein
MIFLMMRRRPRHLLRLFAQSQVRLGPPPIQRGEEKLSRESSSIGLAGDVQLIPMPWNLIFPPTVHIPLGRSSTMA